MKRIGVMAGDIIMVRLALLPGMPETDPTPEELFKARATLADPSMRQTVLDAARENQKNAGLTAAQLEAQFSLYPRMREATVTFVDRTTGLPGQTESAVHSINVEVRNPVVAQAYQGVAPLWAQPTFRLTSVPWHDEEPEDHQDQHVAFPVPEPKEA